MSRRTLEEIAYHEAGHAVLIAFSGEYVLDGLSLAPMKGDLPQLDSAGRALITPALQPLDLLGSHHREQAEAVLTISLAGPAAGYLFTNRPRANSDYWEELAGHSGLHELLCAHADGCPSEYRQWLAARAKMKVEGHWPAVQRLASALLEQRMLSGDEARKIITGRGC